jgi:hypothetical protein
MEDFIYELNGEQIVVKAENKENFESLFPEAVLKQQAENFQPGVPNVDASETPVKRRIQQSGQSSGFASENGFSGSADDFENTQEKATAIERQFGKNIVTDFFGDLYRAGVQGSAAGSSVDEAFDVYKRGDDISDEDLQKFIDANERMENAGTSDEMLEYQKLYDEAGGGLWGFLSANAQTRGAVLPQIIVSSVANMATSAFDSEEVFGTAAASAGVGATAGTAILPGAGTLTGAGAGFVGGLVGAMETGLTLSELLKEELDGADFNKENVRKILEDSDAFDRIKSRAVGRGLAIGAVEAATLGLSRGVATKLGKTAMTTTKKGAVIAGVEAVGGSTGEVAGRLAADQEMDTSDILFEGVAELKGVINVADILAKKSYKVNGKKSTRKEILKFVTNPNTRAEDIAAADIDVQGDVEFKNFIENKQADIYLESTIPSIVTDSKDREALFELEKERNKYKDNKSKTAQNLVTEINTEIKEITDKYKGRGRRTTAQVNQAKQDEAVQKASEERTVAKTIRFAETQGGKIGLNTVVLDDSISFENELKKDGIKLSKEDKKQIDLIGGYIEGNKIYINKSAAAKTGQINVGGHELLHGILANAKIDNLNSLVEDFKTQLDKKTLDILENNMVARGYNKSADLYAKEYLTNFSDMIESGEIKFNENVFTKIGNAVVNLLKLFGYENINFKDGKGVYNFMKEYSKNIKSGELSSSVISQVTDSKSVEGSLSIADEKVAKVNKIYNDSSDKTQAGLNIAMEYSGMAEKYITDFKNNPNLSEEQKALIDRNREDIRAQILYDKLPSQKADSKNRNVLGLVQSFESEKQKYNNVAAYINTFFKRRALETMNYNFKEAGIKSIENEDGTIRKDVAKKTSSSQNIKINKKQEKGINRKIKLDDLANEIFENSSDIVKTIEESFNKEIKLQVRKGTLKSFDIEKFVKTSVRQAIVNKFGKITQTKNTAGERVAVVPNEYKSILVSQFENIIDAFPIKDIKKRYSKLFKIKEIRREKTREGNPIYEIPKPDKKEFVKFFTEGRPTTIIEKQKILSEIIGNYLTSKVISDFITTENLKELNSISELAPSVATDVVENIIIENELNKLAAQADRYAGEKMLQDERLFSKSAIASKSKVLELSKIELDSDEFNNYKAPKVVKDFVRTMHAKGIIKGNRFGGVIYEELLLDKIAKAGGVIKILKSGAAYDSTAADLQLLINDIKVNIEAKLNSKALFGQTGIKVSFNNNQSKIEFLKNNKVVNKNELSNYELFESMVNQSLPFIKNILDQINEIEKTNFNSFPLGTHIAQSTWQKVQESESYKLLTKINKKMSSKVVADHYNAKDMYYIQIGDKGLYHLGIDKYGLGTKEFNVEFLMPLGFKQSGAATIIKGFKGKRVRISFKSEAKIFQPAKLNPSPINLENTEGINLLGEKVSEGSFSRAALDKGINDIIEEKTGIGSQKIYSIEKSKIVGARKGKFNFYIAPSAEDFVGLLYKFLSKGKLGDLQMAWFKKHLLNPYSKAMHKLNADRMVLMNDFRALKRKINKVPKKLKKFIPNEGFTYETAVRTYIWDQQGMSIPGLSKADQKSLVKIIKNDKELKSFADQVILIHKDRGYPNPQQHWSSGTMTTDMLNGLNTVRRKEILSEWKANVDIIFSNKNLNKMEAAFGGKFKEAMVDILSRMETGRNRPYGGNRIANAWLDWVNNSVGVVMFLNMRSALLQTISTANYINWGDNNVLSAGKAFANQPQYWKDFLYIWNSDYLKERRGGLKLNVSESEIADMANQGGVNGVVSFILKNGFLPTKVADSFAIASGGASMYRNRVKTYKKQGLSTEKAEAKAFKDFRELTEEAQQSSRPDRISLQQASPAGRLFLAWANTPMQYGRLIKRSTLDLIAGRGDRKTNLSKLIYYTAIQNIIFNAMQQGMFAMAFNDENDEEEDIKKYSKVGEGMFDSILKGGGIQGSVIIALKNIIADIYKRSQKPRPNYKETLWKFFDVTPPLDSKMTRLKSASYSFEYEAEAMQEEGFSLDNPAVMATSQLISFFTNIPLDRAVKKANNIQAATSEEAETWQRIALILGWSEWELGMTEDANKFKVRKNIRKPAARKSSPRRTIQKRN